MCGKSASDIIIHFRVALLRDNLSLISEASRIWEYVIMPLRIRMLDHFRGGIGGSLQRMAHNGNTEMLTSSLLRPA